MKIVADAAIPYVSQVFAGLGEIELLPGHDITQAVLQDCDVLIVRTVTSVNRELLHGTPVRYVASATSGIDHVDIDYLRESDIGFLSAPGCNAQSVCEYVLSSIFCLQDQLALDMDGLQIGIIGCGNVGSQLAKQLQALSMIVNVYDPFICNDDGEYPFQDLAKVLQSDVVSIHVPLTDRGPYPTRNLVNEAFLQQLKKNVILINSSRGEVIDEQALINFLKNHPASHVVLDVWANEPCISTDLLQQVDIATPHIAGYSLDAKLNATWMVYSQLMELMGQEQQAELPELPPAEISELRLDIGAVENELEAVKLAVLSSYDVRSDSAALRRIIELQEESQGPFFDALRANYPVRRGFGNMHIEILGESSRLQTQLSALGFQFE